jgi:hypothetical protein
MLDLDPYPYPDSMNPGSNTLVGEAILFAGEKNEKSFADVFSNLFCTIGGEFQHLDPASATQ